MGLNEPLGLINRFTKIDKGYIIITGNALVLCHLTQADETCAFIITDTSKQISGYPARTSFISDSVKIDNISKTASNLTNGIVFQSIPTKTSTTITWKILINDDPPQVSPIPCLSTIDTQTSVVKTTNTVNTQVNYINFTKTRIISQNVDKQYADLDDEIAVDDNQITNQVQGSYSYSVNGVLSNFTNTINSESLLNIQVFTPSIVFEKTCNKLVVREGDTFIYNVLITNTGDIDVSEGVLIDNIPTQFSIEEIKIDSVVVQGNILTGLNIGSIPIGTTKIVSLTVRALSINPNLPIYINEITGDFKIITDPNQPFEIITQTATVQEGITVLKPSLDLNKSVSVQYAALKDVILYTLVAKNTGNNDTGNLLLKDVIVQDFLTPELEFVLGSLKVDGDEYPNTNIADGINIGNLDVGDIKTITFEVTIVAFKNTPVTNVSSAKYTFNLSPNSLDQIGTISSNSIDIIIKNPNLTIQKEVDKTTASLNDILNYTVKIKNTGQLNLINILLKDNIPDVTKIVDGSFSIDGKVVNSVELDKGVSLKNMNVGEEFLIKYSCIVTGINLSGKAENYITAYFSYVFLDGTTGTKEANSNIVTVLVNLNTFKQFTVSEYISIPLQEPDVKRVNNVLGIIEIINHTVIETSKIKSLEGQELSGYKLIVHGVIKETIEYVANDSTESIHAVNKDIKFSTFIILPSNYNVINKLEISSVLEKAYANNSDPRNLFSNATILIKVRIL